MVLVFGFYTNDHDLKPNWQPRPTTKTMIITWYGHSCFKLESGGVVVVTDPFPKKIGLKPFQGKADIVTLSHKHWDHNNTSAVKGKPFIADGPGEYEIKKVVIRGILSFHDKVKGKTRGLNTVYLIQMGKIRLCHLGDLGHILEDDQLEKIGQVDILMIPVGGTFTIDSQEAPTIINQIEPRIIIPMHYQLPKLKVGAKLAGVEKFLKEMGVSPKPIEKLVVKKKDLLQGKTEVAVMKI